MLKEFLNKKIPAPIGIIIILILAILVGQYIIWQYLTIKEEINFSEIIIPEKKDVKFCVTDEDCIVFGQDGDCNCGCFNKNYNWQVEGACFCAVPDFCKCIEGRCEDNFEFIE